MGAQLLSAGRPGLSPDALSFASLEGSETAPGLPAGPARHVLTWIVVSCVWATLATSPGMAQPVDYETEVQPIFDRSCSCHVGAPTSGLELGSYEALFNSVGVRYGTSPVVPGDAAASPLYDKVATDTPLFGDRMPFGGGVLPEDEIALIGRWMSTTAAASTSAIPSISSSTCSSRAVERRTATPSPTPTRTARSRSATPFTCSPISSSATCLLWRR